MFRSTWSSFESVSDWCISSDAHWLVPRSWFHFRLLGTNKIWNRLMNAYLKSNKVVIRYVSLVPFAFPFLWEILCFLHCLYFNLESVNLSCCVQDRLGLCKSHSGAVLELIVQKAFTETPFWHQHFLILSCLLFPASFIKPSTILLLSASLSLYMCICLADWERSWWWPAPTLKLPWWAFPC